MYIERFIKKDILNFLKPNKVVVIYGPRRVGKTTLIKKIIEELKKNKGLKEQDYLFLSGEFIETQEWLSSQSLNILKENIGNKKLLIIDEAQKIPNIGLNLKLIVDHMDGVKVLATGSSSFDLANQVGEPLVGRKWQFTLYPIAQLELSPIESHQETIANLKNRIVYGSYPDIITSKSNRDKELFLEEIVNSYLYKDIIELDGIKKSRKIIKILTMLAFQIGQEVSIKEIANAVDLDIRTVDKYIDLLEKSFVIKYVGGFSRNLRKEVTKNGRYYFYDNGIRNAVIKNFNEPELRNDVGQLWENYIFMERLKKTDYEKISLNRYFWRTWDKKEIDIVEERKGKLYGYEVKWSNKKRPKPPKDWLKNYDNAEYEVINRENYLKFIS